MCFFLSFIFVVLLVLLSVAFFTLFERKVLGFTHTRMGPNKVFMGGYFQPLSDAVKLFSKEDLKFSDLNFMYFAYSPMFFLVLMMFLWGLFSFWGVMFFSNYSLIIFICLIGGGVYFLLFSGWSSSSSFSMLGSCRSSAQSISYEVLMVFLLLFFMYFWCTLGFLEYVFVHYGVSLFLGCCILSFCWILSCLAESNRSPFDFSEGESELVSGFNTEYGGGFFSFIFIAEYGYILALSFFSALLLLSFSVLFLVASLVSFFYLWVRSTYARLRYDFLMVMSWSGLLFLVVSVYFVFFVAF